MATRMQQRRGTASQWTTANPILNAGEMGWESDTNKFKIGDGTNHWADLDYFADINSTVNPAFGSSITFEGATADSYETVLQVTDPTADRTITLPNVTGTVITTGNLSDITNIGVFTSTITMEGSTADDHELTISAGDPTADRTATFPDATGTIVLDTATQTLTNKTLTSPTVSGLTLSDGSIVVEGATANNFETTIQFTDPTEDRTITFPDATGTVALTENLTTSLTGQYVEVGDIGAIDGVPGLDGSLNILAPAGIIFEGTANDFETTFQVTDPTADRTITFPNETGTVALTANVAALSGATFTGAVSGTDLTLSGNLTVNGTTTNINSTNLVVEDKNIVLGDTAEPADATADGGGITLKGTTDKTFNWVDSTDSWTSSEHLFLSATKELRLADTDSSHYVGFKSPGTVTANKVWVLPAADGTAGQALSTDGSGNLSWATAAAGGADEILILMGAL